MQKPSGWSRRELLASAGGLALFASPFTSLAQDSPPADYRRRLEAEHPDKLTARPQ